MIKKISIFTIITMLLTSFCLPVYSQQPPGPTEEQIREMCQTNCLVTWNNDWREEVWDYRVELADILYEDLALVVALWSAAETLVENPLLGMGEIVAGIAEIWTDALPSVWTDCQQAETNFFNAVDGHSDDYFECLDCC